MYVNASKTSKELPGVSIGDRSVEASGWNWQDGWHGLVPSRSTLADAKTVLGEITNISELANGICYYFNSGSIKVFMIDSSQSIMKIRIDSHSAQPFKPPENIDEAQEFYGKLIATAVDRHEGVVFERPGMRICCDPMQETNPLGWMEIFKPPQD